MMNGSQGAILLVEDDLSIRRSLKAVLKELHFDVGEASSGEEALITLRQRTFDVVLMDLNMPGMGAWKRAGGYAESSPPILLSQSLYVTARTTR